MFFFRTGDLDDKMKWLKNFDRLLEIQRNIVWPSVLELDPKQVTKFGSISPTFYEQLLHQYSFVKKLQSRTAIREKLYKTL
jgi:hypothetical protein